MDPITLAIITGLMAGTRSGSHEVDQKAITDAYNGLKELIRQKFGKDSDLADTIDALERKPDSEARKGVLQYEVESAQAAHDPEVVAAATALLEKLKSRGADANINGSLASITDEGGMTYTAQAGPGGTAVINFQKVVSLEDIDDEELKYSYKKLLKDIDNYFFLVGDILYLKPQFQETAINHLENARTILRETENDPAWTLSRAQFEVYRVYLMITRERQILKEENRWRLVVPALILVYILAIVGIIFLGNGLWTSTTKIPMVGVPVSVLIWAALGSLSAILYRFYTSSSSQITTEIPWLIARPIIGIIMGALSYIAIISGLLIFGTAVGVDPDSEAARPELLWALAFVAGFSDKFFEAIIENVVGKWSSLSNKENLHTPVTS